MTAADPGRLTGTWAHVHEEDGDGLQVFRPGDQPLPPARGRTFLTLEPDGSASRRAPGPDDRRVRSEGRWEVDGERLRVSFGDQRALVFDIVSAEPGRLALRPQISDE
jgi:hypothetical protein